MESVTLTNRQARTIYVALMNLDGRVEADKKVIPFKFDGTSRLDIAHNVRVFSEAFDVLEKARVAMIAEARGKSDNNEPLEESHPGWAEFQDRWQKILDEKVTLEIRPINYREIKAEENQIGVSVLGPLTYIFAK